MQYAHLHEHPTSEPQHHQGAAKSKTAAVDTSFSFDLLGDEKGGDENGGNRSDGWKNRKGDA